MCGSWQVPSGERRSRVNNTDDSGEPIAANLAHGVSYRGVSLGEQEAVDAGDHLRREVTFHGKRRRAWERVGAQADGKADQHCHQKQEGSTSSEARPAWLRG